MKLTDEKGEVIHEANVESLCALVEDALKRGICLRGADLRNAHLRGADLRDTNIDFATIQLCCSLFKAKICNNIAAQWLYHFCRFESGDPEVTEIQKKCAAFANTWKGIDRHGLENIKEEQEWS